MTNFLLNNIQYVNDAVLSPFEWNSGNSMTYNDNFDTIFHHIKHILRRGQNRFDGYLLHHLNHLDPDSINFNFLQLVGGGLSRKYRLNCAVNSPPIIRVGIVTTTLNFVLTPILFNNLDLFVTLGVEIPPYYALLFNGNILDLWQPNLDFHSHPSSQYYLMDYFNQAVNYDAPGLIEDRTGVSQDLWNEYPVTDNGYSSNQSRLGPQGTGSDLVQWNGGRGRNF